MTLDALLHRHAELQPTKPAILTLERSIGYAELDDSVSCLARRLLNLGLCQGDRVAVHWSNSIETVQLLLGVFRAGLIAVPINVRLKAPEIAYIFQHAGVRICFSEPAVAPLAKGVEAVSELPALTGASGPLPEVDSDQPALILYTSGTTARPKGAVHTHCNMFEAANLMTPEPVGQADTVLAITQLAHVSALNGVLLPALQQGASAVLLRAFGAGAALDLIERFTAHILWRCRRCCSSLQRSRHAIRATCHRCVTSWRGAIQYPSPCSSVSVTCSASAYGKSTE